MFKILKPNCKQEQLYNIQEAESLMKPLKLGTKAETLENLRLLLRESKVLDLLYFTVSDFEDRCVIWKPVSCLLSTDAKIDKNGAVHREADYA